MRRIVLRVAEFLLIAWKPVEWLLTKLEHVEFVANAEHAKMAAEVFALLPSYVGWLAPIAGLGLIGWDIWDSRRYRRQRGPEMPRASPVSAEPSATAMVAGQAIRELSQRPGAPTLGPRPERILLSFEKQSPWVIPGDERPIYGNNTAIRVGISTQHTIRRAQVRLMGVYEKQGDRWSMNSMTQNVRVTVGWFASDKSFEPLDVISQHQEFFVPFLIEANGCLRMLIERDDIPELKQVASNIPPNRYKFVICIQGENFEPVTANLLVEWYGGNLQGFHMTVEVPSTP
jgi:hypothetical protein